MHDGDGRAGRVGGIGDRILTFLTRGGQGH